MIKSIKGNVKKGVNATLGKNTLIIGPNGSGKSSIVNAIELLCGGFATDVMGRSVVKKSSDLIVLSQDGKTLEVEGEIGDEKIQYQLTSEEGRVSKEKNKPPSMKIAFPFLAVREHLTKSAEKARVWFLQHANMGVESKDIQDQFPDGMHDQIKQMFERRQGKPIERLLNILETAKTKYQGHQSKLRSLKGLIDLNVASPMEPSELEIKNLELEKIEALKVYSEWQTSMKNYQPEVADMAKSKAVNAAKKAELARKQLEEYALSFDEAYPNASSQLAQAQQAYSIGRQIAQTAHLHAKLNASTCMVCQRNGTPDFATIADNMYHQADQFEDMITKHDKLKKGKQQLVELQGEAQTGIEDWNEAVEAENRWKEIENEQETRELHYKYLENLHAQKVQDKISWDRVRQLKDEVKEIEGQMQKDKDFYLEVSKVSQWALKVIIQKFTETVNHHLPPCDTFHVELTDTLCRIGLMQSGNLVCALSGAEWVRVILAIGMATETKDQFNIYIPEERAFDSVTLGVTMKALATRKGEGQVILTSTIKPRKGKYWQDWTIIELT